MTQALQLLTTKHYDGIEFDCYVEAEQTNSGEFWATRTQIGELLGYENPRKAIKDIHERHRERLDKLSIVVKMPYPVRGAQNEPPFTNQQETTLYSFKGMLEICRYSHKPKANAIMDWLWEVADEIRRTGSYTLKPEVPQGEFEAAKTIALKALDSEEDEDFIAVLAMDKIFSNLYGKSALDLADLSIYELTEYVALDDSDTPPLAKYSTHFELKNGLCWEKYEALVNPEVEGWRS